MNNYCSQNLPISRVYESVLQSAVGLLLLMEIPLFKKLLPKEGDTKTKKAYIDVPNGVRINDFSV
jgi:hypothetical protein